MTAPVPKSAGSEGSPGSERPIPLEIVGLRFGRRRRTVLADVTFDLRPGEIACVIGPNGSGKSTLLRCLAGALTPAEGNLRFGGEELTRLGAEARARILSYAPQEVGYAFAYTVSEFLGLSAPDHAAPELLDAFDLTELLSRSLLTLSGGERQRAAITRALIRRTPFLLLDEPTAHLDLRHQRQLLVLLREEAKVRNRGVLLVLHDLNLAAALADRLHLLHDGRFLASGPPEAVLTVEHIGTAYRTAVRRFVGPTGEPVILLSQ
ncbi:MAG: ABC transporter ATP-binding protein [Capsulimonadales bacterium]|nr:ABC transporter ATP-binding protein [Capsulimonadales bacterium]